jgi:hypothetical protein
VTAVSKTHVAVYVKDHLGGSEAALEILDHLESTHGSGAIGDAVRRLRTEIIGERGVLKQLLEQLDGSTSVPRRVIGWLSEKALELKLIADDPGGGALRLFEALETLELGVHGKLGLWKALQANVDAVPILATVEYVPLIRQAEAQETLLESLRLDAARSAFANSK